MTPVAIITGASRGLGRALAVDLVRDGWAVVADARRAPLPDGVHGVPGDVTDPRHRGELVVAARSLGALMLVVNNASALGPSPLPALRAYPVEQLEHVLRTNVLAPLALTQLAIEDIVANQGAIVNITSDASVEPYEGWGGYGSSKAALDQLSRVLGAEEPDIRVWAFDPGDMRTQMHQDAFPGEDISDRPEAETVVPALRQLLVKRPPSGRVRAADLLAPVTR